MATYIQGVEDYIPSLEPFKPDYKFLSNVLDIRQDRYDSNYEQLNNLYNYVLNADLSIEANREKRDQYANRLTNGLKQVSGLDLSLQQNVDAAKGLFKPFFEDKEVLYDMGWTKQYKNQMKQANFYATSGRDEDNRLWWQDGVRKLEYEMKDFQNSSPSEALNKSMPVYVEAPDIFNRAYESLKESGLSIKQTTPNGMWLITNKNGTALTERVIGYKTNEAGTEYLKDESGNYIPITTDTTMDYLANTVQKNPKVQRALAVSAYVAAREFYEDPENIQQYGSEENAKKAWAAEWMKKSSDEDTRKLAATLVEKKDTESIVQRWENYKKQKGIVPGSPEEDIVMKKAFELQILQSNQSDYESRIKKLKSPVNDIEKLMGLAYIGHMNTEMYPLLKQAGIQYSLIDAEIDYEINPVAKLEVEQQYRLQLQALRDQNAMARIYAQGDVQSILQKQKHDLDLEMARLKGELGADNSLGFGTYGERSLEGDMNLQGVNAKKNIWGNIKWINRPNRISDNTAGQNDAVQLIQDTEIALMKEMLTQFPGEWGNTDMIKNSGGTIRYSYKDCLDCKTEIRENTFVGAIQDLTKTDKNGSMINEGEYKKLYNTIELTMDSLATKTSENNSDVLLYQSFPQLNDKGANIIQMHADILSMKTKYRNLTNQQNEVYFNTQNQMIADKRDGIGEYIIEQGYPLFVQTPRSLAMQKDGVPTSVILDMMNDPTNFSNKYPGYEKYNDLDNTTAVVSSKGEFQAMFIDLAMGGMSEKEMKKYLDTNYGSGKSNWRGKPEHTTSGGRYKPSGNGIPLFEKNPLMKNYWKFTMYNNMNTDGNPIDDNPHLDYQTMIDGNHNYWGVWEFDIDKAKKDANIFFDGQKGDHNHQSPVYKGKVRVFGNKNRYGVWQEFDARMGIVNSPERGTSFSWKAGWMGQDQDSGSGTVMYTPVQMLFDPQNPQTNAAGITAKDIVFSDIMSQRPGTAWQSYFGNRLGESVDKLSKKDDLNANAFMNSLMLDMFTKLKPEDQPVLLFTYIESASSDNDGTPEGDWAGWHIQPQIDYAANTKFKKLLESGAIQLNIPGMSPQTTWESFATEGITIFHSADRDQSPWHSRGRMEDALAQEIIQSQEPKILQIPNAGMIQLEMADPSGQRFLIKHNLMSFKNDKNHPDYGKITFDGWGPTQEVDAWGLTRLYTGNQAFLVEQRDMNVALRDQWAKENNINLNEPSQ